MPDKIGRPSDYSPEIAIEICNRLLAGKNGESAPESLRSICRDEKMPHIATVLRWMLVHDEFREQYVRTREIQQEVHYEELFEIADNCTDDVDILVSESGKEKAHINFSAINRAKLRIDTRKWCMERMAAKKYGNKVDLNLSGTVVQKIQREIIDPQNSDATGI